MIKREIYCVVLNKCKTERGMIADTLIVDNPHNNTVVKQISFNKEKTHIIIEFENDTRMITAYTNDVDIFERNIDKNAGKNANKNK